MVSLVRSDYTAFSWETVLRLTSSGACTCLNVQSFLSILLGLTPTDYWFFLKFLAPISEKFSLALSSCTFLSSSCIMALRLGRRYHLCTKKAAATTFALLLWQFALEIFLTPASDTCIWHLHNLSSCLFLSTFFLKLACQQAYTQSSMCTYSWSQACT